MLKPFVLFLFFYSISSFSAVGSNIGFNAKSISLGGQTAIHEKSGTSVFENPALLSRSPSTSEINLSNKPLFFSLGMIYQKSNFKSINGPVVIENTTTGDGVKTGSVDTEYPSTLGQVMGINYIQQKNSLKPSFGLLIYLPVDRLALIDSGEPFLPEYSLYRSRNQRPEFHVGGGIEITPDFHVGLGLQFGSGLNAKANVFLQSDTQKSSSMRILASLKTKISPYFGLHWTPFFNFKTGLVFRMPLDNPETIQINSSGRVIGDLAAIDFNFRSLSSAYYEPLQIEWGNQLKVSEKINLNLQIDAVFWGKFKSSRAELNSAGTTNCAPNCGGLQFSSSQYPNAGTKNIIIPKIGFEWADFRFGYSYESSIYSGNKIDHAHNLLDPSKHKLMFGYGFKGSDFLSTEVPYTLDFSLMYTQLDSYEMSRKADEIGANGFPVGGNLLGSALSLGLFF